jgi:hypothetical protein
MAKAPPEKELKQDVAVVENKSTSLAVSEDMFAADAGGGMEGATQESFAIPFLGVLQKGSPQVDEALGQAIEGAKAGMFFENVTGRMIDGKKGVLLVPCAYRRVFIKWGGKKSANSGFKGEMLPEEVAALRAAGKIVELENKLYVPLESGAVDPDLCDNIVDTRNHYVLLMDEESGAWTNALVSLSRTQLKKSKSLMSALASVKIQGAAGMYTPPTFANLVRATTLGESNDKGAWFGVRFELSGKVNRLEVYEAAKAFHAAVAKGTVEVKYEETAEGTSEKEGF